MDANPQEPAQAEGSEVIVIADASVDPHVVMYHEPRSIQAEQYRAFRTNILALSQGRGSRSFAITSSLKGEGKSLSAVNIAIAIAETPGSRVCLVDTDFRKPRVGDLLGLPPGPGLSELLLDEVQMSRVISETKVSNLHVIRSGREPRNPSELLGSARIKDLMAVLKTDFTHIICDTPPVNPYTDAAVLGAQLDGVLLVVRAGRTPKEQAERARLNLERAGARVLGVFLTDAMPVDKNEIEYYRQLDE